MPGYASALSCSNQLSSAIARLRFDFAALGSPALVQLRSHDCTPVRALAATTRAFDGEGNTRGFGEGFVDAAVAFGGAFWTEDGLLALLEKRVWRIMNIMATAPFEFHHSFFPSS